MKEGENKIEITLTENHRAKICLDMICKFLNLIPGGLRNIEKDNFSVRDYTLQHFQQYIGRTIDNTDPYKNKFLESNIDEDDKFVYLAFISRKERAILQEIRGREEKHS